MLLGISLLGDHQSCAWATIAMLWMPLVPLALEPSKMYLSNIYAREPFRHQSSSNRLARRDQRFGVQSYSLALEAAAAGLN